MEVREEAGKEEEHWSWGDRSSPFALGFLVCEMDVWSPVPAPSISPHLCASHRGECWYGKCKSGLHTCLVSQGRVTSSTASNPTPFCSYLQPTFVCSRGRLAVLETLHSVPYLILTSCLWTRHYHFPHFTDEETHSRALAINHRHTVARTRENATYRTGTVLG